MIFFQFYSSLQTKWKEQHVMFFTNSMWLDSLADETIYSHYCLLSWNASWLEAKKYHLHNKTSKQKLPSTSFYLLSTLLDMWKLWNMPSSCVLHNICASEKQTIPSRARIFHWHCEFVTSHYIEVFQRCFQMGTTSVVL